MWIDARSPLSTMAPSKATAPSHANQQARTAPPTVMAQQVSKSLVTQEFDLMIQAFFLTPMAPTKFNPIHTMSMILQTMLKDKLSLVLCTPSNDKQLVLASALILTGESEFKKVLQSVNPRSKNKNLLHICIGWHVLSDQSLGQIKFQSTNSNLLTWLKKGRIFLESDGLGMDHLVTIGYFTKIDSTLTHLTNVREHLVNQLMLQQHRVHSKFVRKCVYKKYLMLYVTVPNYVCRFYIIFSKHCS